MDTRNPGNIYLDHLVAPYVDAMKNVHDAQIFFNWASQIIQPDDEEYFRIEDAREFDLET